MTKKKRERPEPVPSLYPYKLEDVIRAFMQVDRKKVDKRLKKKGIK